MIKEPIMCGAIIKLLPEPNPTKPDLPSTTNIFRIAGDVKESFSKLLSGLLGLGIRKEPLFTWRMQGCGQWPRFIKK